MPQGERWLQQGKEQTLLIAFLLNLLKSFMSQEQISTEIPLKQRELLHKFLLIKSLTTVHSLIRTVWSECVHQVSGDNVYYVINTVIKFYIVYLVSIQKLQVLAALESEMRDPEQEEDWNLGIWLHLSGAISQILLSLALFTVLFLAIQIH